MDATFFVPDIEIYQSIVANNVLSAKGVSYLESRGFKKDFIDKIPKQFKIDVEELESKSSKYYHPIIILNEDYIKKRAIIYCPLFLLYLPMFKND